MLRVMLTSFLLCFVHFQPTDFFHHLLLRVLQWLQHFNEGVGIISGDSWSWLWFSPHSVNTFRPVRLLLVRRCWPRFCLRGHGAHVSCHPGSWWHLFARTSVPICFPTPLWSHQFKCAGPFLQCWAGLPLTVLGPSVLSKGVETNLAWTHFDPACAQTMPRLPRTSFTCPWQAKLLRMSYASRHDNNNKRKYFWL